jgi:hypothetical protein
VGGIALAWAVGEGIIVYRSIRTSHAPPVPGALLASSGLFVLLALLAQAQQGRILATTLAWGLDAAAFFNLYAPVTGGGGGSAQVEPTPSGKTPPNITGSQGSSA